MSLPSTTNGIPLTTPTCVGAWIEYPFRDMGDSDTKVYRHKMQVALGAYSPLQDNDTLTNATEKPTRSPFPDDADAFFIGDSTPIAIDGLMLEFVRSFANVPQDRTVGNGGADPFGLYAFEFPETDSISNTYISTGAESFSYDGPTHTSTIVFNLSGGNVSNLSVGGQIDIENTASSFFVKYDRSPPTGAVTTVYSKKLKGCVITSISSNKVTCSYVWNTWYDSPVLDSGDDYGGVSASTYEAIDIVMSGRLETLQANSPAFVEKIYIKSDNIYNITSSLDKMFKVYLSTGVESLTKELGSATDPTNDEYGNLVLNGLTINAEDQTITRWNGNIFELSTIKIIAQ